ncbi:beta-(1-6) glucans synthase, partial [Rhodopseudomonas palustris]
LISWLAVGTSATVAGVLLGIAVDKLLVESYGVGRWAQWSLLLASGILTPILGAHALMSGRPLPTFLDLFGPREDRSHSLATWALGLAVAVTVLIGAQTALGFTFDPRYRDFPFASLTMAVVPLFLLMLLNRPQQGLRPIAEASFAGLFAVCALYTVFNEGPKNWQSLWTCAVYAMLALTLWRARVAQTPK